jgi:hypothetical protein
MTHERKRAPSKLTYEVMCNYCRTLFTAHRRNHIYCTVRCKTAGVRLRQTLRELNSEQT